MLSETSFQSQVSLPAQDETFMTIGTDEIDIRFLGRGDDFKGDMKAIAVTAGRAGIYVAFSLDAFSLFF